MSFANTPDSLSSMLQKIVKSAESYNTALAGTLKKPDNPSVEIIGVTDFELVEQTIEALGVPSLTTNGLTATVDSGTYPDHAVLAFTNGLGYDAYLTQLTIHGKPIKRYRGTLIHDSLRRDDDIRKNGEKTFELENEYIIDATQVAKLADFHFKDKGKKKHLYALTLKGFRPWYSPGDWYSLAYGTAGKNEYVNSTVECYDVQCERAAGSIGTTTLLLREVEENWQKTTFYTARARSAGSPKRRNQQSNTVIVASSTFSGTYDYRCDAVSDDVQIKEAVEYIYNTYGGGTVQLTHGNFYVRAGYINIPAGVILRGEGWSTKINYELSYNSEIMNLAGDGAQIRDLMYISTIQQFRVIQSLLSYKTTIDNVRIVSVPQNDVSTNICILAANQGCMKVSNCLIETSIPTGNTSVTAIYKGYMCTNNILGDITGSGSGVAYGFDSCTKCQQNHVASATTAKYHLSYADSGSSHLCADSSDGGYNS